MKKWISFLLCLLMLSSCITISATAIQAEPTVALSSAQGAAGDTVSITATVANNPGIVSMYLNLEYDRSRLELISATDCGLLEGKTFTNNVSTYPYALTWDDSLAEGNNTSNGDLVILTFKIRDDAPAGDAAVTLKNSGGIIDFDLNRVKFTFVSGTISVVDTQVEPDEPDQPVGSATVSLSSSQGSAGDTVSITATVANNPGIVSMYLNLEYDRSRLELISVTDCGLLAGNTFTDKVSTYPYVLTWDDSLAEGNNTSNGDLVVLTFKILEDAPVGDATIMLKNSGGIIDFDLNRVSFAFVSGIITVESSLDEPDNPDPTPDPDPTPGNPSKSRIASADMILGQNITVNYYAKLDSTHMGAQMRFTINGVETIVDGDQTEEAGVYVYAFQKIAPQCMGDNIKAELILGDVVLDVKEEYSVKTYCRNMLAKSAADLGMSAEKYEALRTLIADTLEYGARAQLYVGYKTNELVNEGITGQSEFVELNSNECASLLEKGDNFNLTGVQFVSAGVYFDSYNALYVKFNAPGVADGNFIVRLKDGNQNIIATYKLSDCQLISEANSTYLLVLPALYATQFEDFYWIELCEYTSQATTVQWSLRYGVSSYVCAKQNQVDKNGALTPMAELARATYNYGLSAVAYKAFAN